MGVLIFLVSQVVPKSKLLLLLGPNNAFSFPLLVKY